MARARILVVEDTPLNLELATDILEAAGYEVLQATSGEAALAMARSATPDLILLDIRLPGMDGFATLKALQADPTTSAIRAVALTAQAMKGDDAAALAAGFHGYLAKPIDTRTFVGSVAAFLPGREA